MDDTTVFSSEDFSESEQKIAVALHYISHSCDRSVLQSLLSIPDDAFDVGLGNLIHAGIVTEHDNEVSSEKPLTDSFMRDFFNNPFENGTVFDVVSLAFHEDYEFFFIKSLALFRNSVGQGDYGVSKLQYEILSKFYVKLKLDKHNDELGIKFIYTVYDIISIAHMFPWNIRETLRLILKARGIAFRCNDEKYITLLNLSLGYLCVTDYLNTKNNWYIEIVKREVFKHEKSCNKDLEHYFVPFKSFVYYLEGNFIKSINCVFYYSNATPVPDNLYLRLSFTYSAMSAIVNGEHDIALTILNNGIKLTSKDKLQAMSNEILCVFRAFVYMLKGDEEKIKSIIESYNYTNIKNNLTMGALWLIRLRSYYYYLKKDIKKSYSYYISGMKEAIERGYLGYILAPFMLKVLAQYNISGFPDPFNHSVIDEIKSALDSPSILHLIVANRELAEITAHRYGWKNSEAQKFIQTSLRLAYTISAPLERAQTMIVYIRMMVELKKVNEATQVMHELLSIKSRYPQLTIPHSINDLLAQLSSDTPLRPGPEQESRANLKQQKFSDIITKDGFVYKCDRMRQLEKRVKIIAPKNVSVLIQGESGVGKEHIARQLHNLSGRKGRFVAINLTSIPEDLFESEFYGHEKGAFTGAVNNKKGLFEIADQGTLFLDEVGDTSLRIQAKLLRVLQEKEFMKVGGTAMIKSEFRIISATNKNLRKAIKNKTFREDLYYRLNVVSLEIPPLREREDDIVCIAESFLEFYCQKYSLNRRKFSQDDISFLVSYSWPGNVRELKNYIERYVLFSEHYPDNESNLLVNISHQQQVSPAVESSFPDTKSEAYDDNLFLQCSNSLQVSHLPTLNELLSQYVEYVYVLKDGVVGGPDGIANTLDVSKVTVYNWIKKLELKKRFTKKIIARE